MLKLISVLVFIFTIGVGNVWGTDVEFTVNVEKSDGSSMEKDGITISTTSGTFSRTDNYRIYASNSMTISSSVGNITNVAFTISQNTFTANVGTWTENSKSWSGNAESITFSASGGQVRITKIVVTYTAAASCSNKVALTKGSQTNGTFSLNKSNGSYDNCDANFVVTVSNINPTNSSYYCTGVTATGGNSSVSGPDGSGNYTVTYTKGNSITSTVTANFAAKTSRTVTFMRNGVQYGDVRNVYDGDAVGTLPSNPTSCDANKVFAGWSEAQIGSTPTDDAPTFISASTVVSGSNKVYHAVFATDATPAGNLFSWEGSSTNDLASLTGMTGVTSSGLGSYAAGNAPYRVQFDNSSDYITISLSSAPSALTLTTKKIGGAGNSSFTIQESTASNGTFTDVQTFTCTGAQNATAAHTTSTAFKTTTRAIKITFSKASNGNTGVGSIIITPGASYSGYITSCCTPLGQINGSFF